MSLSLLLILALLIAVPIAWLVTEFKCEKGVRICLGLLSIGIISGVMLVANNLGKTFNYNSLYGFATRNLIRTSIHEIEDGNLEQVLNVWRGLDQQYHPTYENRANYSELVEQAVRQMRDEATVESDSVWNAPAFSLETWQGHWVDEQGYWIVISRFGRTLEILQSGQPRPKVNSVTVSEDHRELEFQEGNRWRHTLTLKNKYEAAYEWFDLEQKKIWQTTSIHKLKRATDEEKGMTRASELGNAIGTSPLD